MGGTGHERASKRPHLRTVDRWNADWGALALMVERWLVPLIPFPSYKLCASDRPGAVKGARFARRSEPLTARTDLESYEGERKGILQPSSHLPTKNPEYPKKIDPILRGSSGFLVGGQRVAGSSILPTRRRPQSHRDSLLGRCFRATTTSCGYLSQMDTPLICIVSCIANPGCSPLTMISK